MALGACRRVSFFVGEKVLGSEPVSWFSLILFDGKIIMGEKIAKEKLEISKGESTYECYF